jgi:hypothetical protein
MVNPGHPSRGCWTCRIRRIKCDGSYPTCSRCVKARRICVRYNNLRQSTSRPEVETQMPGYAHHNVTTKKPHISYTGLIDVPSFFTNDALHVGSLSSPGRLPTLSNSDQFATFTTEVVTLGFQSLNSPSQSTKSRRSLHQKYGLAIHHLRKIFLSRPNATILFIPILLFSLYEVKPSLQSISRYRYTNLLHW